MKAKINSKGWLEIERAGKFLIMDCRFNVDAACADDCPLFGEPEKEKMFEPNSKQDRTVLSLCQTVLFINEFTDERE